MEFQRYGALPDHNMQFERFMHVVELYVRKFLLCDAKKKPSCMFCLDIKHLACYLGKKKNKPDKVC